MQEIAAALVSCNAKESPESPKLKGEPVWEEESWKQQQWMDFNESEGGESAKKKRRFNTSHEEDCHGFHQLIRMNARWLEYQIGSGLNGPSIIERACEASTTMKFYLSRQSDATGNLTTMNIRRNESMVAFASSDYKDAFRAIDHCAQQIMSTWMLLCDNEFSNIV